MENSTPNTNPAQAPTDQAATQPVANEAPQNLDKSDAMTYPLGSHNTQPEVNPVQPAVEEDHGSILDKIMGLFSKGKKPNQPEQAQPTSVDQAPTDTTPPPGQ